MKPVSHHEIAQKREQGSRKRSGLLPLKSKQEQASSQKPASFVPPSLLPMHRARPWQSLLRTLAVGLNNMTSYSYLKPNTRSVH